nr:GDCCVxC domain-containing (seleno)protein [Endozoicomonas sp. 4G]
MSTLGYYAPKKITTTEKMTEKTTMKLHVNTESTVTCNSCGHCETETMPLDACVYLYECRSCKNLMTPQKGDCCVFCSRGSHPCPTSQRESKSYQVIPRQKQTALEASHFETRTSMAG